MMASGVRRISPQEEQIRRLLQGSSPRNPTCVLAAVVCDFVAQGSTEITVYQGEEVFMMFEVNDWVYVTLFSNTKRRGYIPLDYCKVIQDFYDSTSHISDNQRDTVPKCATESKSNVLPDGEDNSFKPTIYEHEQFSAKETLKDVQHETSDIHYALDPARHTCCCMKHVKSCCHHNNGFNHVLKYLSQADLYRSPDLQEGSESGLGDSESIHSAGDLMKTSSQNSADLSDMSTQTSLSLENIIKAYEVMDLNTKAYPLTKDDTLYEEFSINEIPPPLAYRNSFSEQNDELTEYSLSSDSVYEESIYDNSEEYHLPNSSLKESFSNVDLSFPDEEYSLSDIEHFAGGASIELIKPPADVKRKLKLPILEQQNQKSRVELSKLSQRIKEKLLPTMAELKTNRDSRKTQPTEVGERLSPTNPVNKQEIRQVTLQSIQEQYMKLEEARLLHNALKQINQVCTSVHN